MHGGLTRRQILGGGTLLAAGWLGALVIGHRPIEGGDSPCLGAAARRTLERAFDVLLDDPEGARIAADGVDAFLATGDPIAASGLVAALVLLEHTGGVGLLSFARFSRLDRDQRVRVLREWETSACGVRRQVFQALRKTAVFANYARPETWPEIGYDGPWVKP